MDFLKDIQLGELEEFYENTHASVLDNQKDFDRVVEEAGQKSNYLSVPEKRANETEEERQTRLAKQFMSERMGEVDKVLNPYKYAEEAEDTLVLDEQYRDDGDDIELDLMGREENTVDVQGKEEDEVFCIESAGDEWDNSAEKDSWVDFENFPEENSDEESVVYDEKEYVPHEDDFSDLTEVMGALDDEISYKEVYEQEEAEEEEEEGGEESFWGNEEPFAWDDEDVTPLQNDDDEIGLNTQRNDSDYEEEFWGVAVEESEEIVDKGEIGGDERDSSGIDLSVLVDDGSVLLEDGESEAIEDDILYHEEHIETETDDDSQVDTSNTDDIYQEEVAEEWDNFSGMEETDAQNGLSEKESWDTKRFLDEEDEDAWLDDDGQQECGEVDEQEESGKDIEEFWDSGESDWEQEIDTEDEGEVYEDEYGENYEDEYEIEEEDYGLEEEQEEKSRQLTDAEKIAQLHAYFGDDDTEDEEPFESNVYEEEVEETNELETDSIYNEYEEDVIYEEDDYYNQLRPHRFDRYRRNYTRELYHEEEDEEDKEVVVNEEVETNKDKGMQEESEVDKLQRELQEARAKTLRLELELEKSRQQKLEEDLRGRKVQEEPHDIYREGVSKQNSSEKAREQLIAEAVQKKRIEMEMQRRQAREASYDDATIPELYKIVKQFMQESGVSKKPIRREDLELKFGRNSVKRLIATNHLLVVGKGVTLGR